MNEMEIREKLVDYGKRLVAAGLVQGTWGNLSMRLDEGHMLVTPSGLDYNRLTPEDMVKVDVTTLDYEGEQKPTSEKGLHAEIYRRRPEAGAVIHTHSKYASVFAAARRAVPVERPDLKKIFGSQIAVGKYGLPGTKTLWKHTIEALGNNQGCIMAAHGMICCGRTMEDAYDHCLKLEECCRQYVEDGNERDEEKMDIKEVLVRQRAFFNEGVTKDLAYRRHGLLKLRAAVKHHEDEIFDALYRDLGKSTYESYETEVGLVYSEITYMLKHLDRLAKPKRVATPLANFPSKSVIFREPFGSVLIMSPWNYPFQLAMVPLIGALAAGNCAVVKPSNYSPAVSDVIAKIISETFSEAYVHVVTGGREANQNLLSQKFDYIFFTGGKVVGRQVMESAAKHLTPVTLELGGKSPCIVDESANIALTARRIVWGKFLNCGQTCVAPDYILVHKSVKSKLLTALVKNIEALYGEDPINSKDYSQIINEKHFDRLSSLIEGEDLYYSGGLDRARLKMGPVIIEDASWESKSMAEEIFGPILPIIEFDDLRRVKKEIEGRPKPLALYLFTRSKASIKYVTKNISFGGGCINDTVMHLATSNMPFGGVGDSGMGNYHGSYSFRTFTHEKSVLHKSNLIDVPLRYPPYGRDTKWLRIFLK